MAADGGVFAYGDASYEKSLPQLGVHVDDIVGIVPTGDGKGYWLVGADGGVFAFGDARFSGSLPALGIHVSDIVGIAATPSGNGYLLVGSDGGVFAFGAAAYRGSLPGLGVVVADIVGHRPVGRRERVPAGGHRRRGVLVRFRRALRRGRCRATAYRWPMSSAWRSTPTARATGWPRPPGPSGASGTPATSDDVWVPCRRTPGQRTPRCPGESASRVPFRWPEWGAGAFGLICFSPRRADRCSTTEATHGDRRRSARTLTGGGTVTDLGPADLGRPRHLEPCDRPEWKESGRASPCRRESYGASRSDSRRAGEWLHGTARHAVPP